MNRGLLWFLLFLVLVAIIVVWFPFHVGPVSLIGLILVLIILAAIFG